jgi:hypothetical protein
LLERCDERAVEALHRRCLAARSLPVLIEDGWTSALRRFTEQNLSSLQQTSIPIDDSKGTEKVLVAEIGQRAAFVGNSPECLTGCSQSARDQVGESSIRRLCGPVDPEPLFPKPPVLIGGHWNAIGPDPVARAALLVRVDLEALKDIEHQEPLSLILLRP